MAQQQSIIELKNKINILEKDVLNIKNEVNDVKKDIKELNKLPDKIDKLIDILSNKSNNNNNLINQHNNIDNKNQNNNNNINMNPYVDNKGSLNNDLNPFINSKSIENIPQVFSADKLKKNKKKYKQRNPLYFYYEIKGNLYKYTCENKERKSNLKFKCSDTKCKAYAFYYPEIKNFKIIEEIEHIDYDSHSYVLPKISHEKYINDSYIASDFKLLDEETNTYTLNKKAKGEYFKQLFLDKEEIKPTSAIE